jgi:hypothetical protein
MSVTLAACSETSTRSLGEHVFDVPNSYDIADNDAPFFLQPLDPRDGFSFYLNRSAALPDRVLVAVASKDRMCAGAVGTEAQINATVCSSQPFAWRKKPLHQVKDGVFWTYDLSVNTLDQDRPTRVSVAGCFQSGGPGRGLCTATLPYRDLVLSLHLTDNEMTELDSLYDQAVAHLDAWER